MNNQTAEPEEKQDVFTALVYGYGTPASNRISVDSFKSEDEAIEFVTMLTEDPGGNGDFILKNPTQADIISAFAKLLNFHTELIEDMR